MILTLFSYLNIYVIYLHILIQMSILKVIKLTNETSQKCSHLELSARSQQDIIGYRSNFSKVYNAIDARATFYKLF